MSEARTLDDDLQGRMGEKLRARLTFRDQTLAAARRRRSTRSTSAALHELARQQVATVEERIANKKADLQLMADAAFQQKRDAGVRASSSRCASR